MRNRALKSVFLSFLLLVSGGAFAYALTPLSSTVSVGDQITFSLAGDYADLIALDLNIGYDPTVLKPVFATTPVAGSIFIDDFTTPDPNLAFIGPSADILAGTDPLIGILLVDDPGVLGLSLASDFFGGALTDLDPTAEIAYFTFEAISAGTSVVSLDGITDSSGFCDPSSDSCYQAEDPFTFDLTDVAIAAQATVTVEPGQQPPTVPVPGLLYLLGMGLAALATSRALGKRA